jgi:2-C-methyl-D-erythritol 4-phosphate cytidylyltransferase
VYLSENGKAVSALLKRSNVFAGQAPEAFRYGAYRKANETLLPEQILAINGSTEPAVLAGLDVVMIPGEEENYKITTQADLERFCQEKEGRV